jgi:hypothetical protein
MTATPVKATAMKTALVNAATEPSAATAATWNSSESAASTERVKVARTAIKISPEPTWTKRTIWEESMIASTEIATRSSGKATPEAAKWTAAVEEVTVRHVWNSVENHHMASPIKSPGRPTPAESTKESESYRRTK